MGVDGICVVPIDNMQYSLLGAVIGAFFSCHTNGIVGALGDSCLLCWLIWFVWCGMVWAEKGKVGEVGDFGEAGEVGELRGGEVRLGR